MNGRNVLVTGASGFIGKNLANHLAKRADACGGRVTCLVRKSSSLSGLDRNRCQLVFGDITADSDRLSAAVAGQDVVFHLAARTRALNRRELMRVNVDGVSNLLNACRCCPTPPVVVIVSSLAAVGPSRRGVPHAESAVCRPISEYGASKLGCESAARKHCREVPVSIVRPPIVLGPYDSDGLALFKSIQSTGFHFVPGFADHHCSVIDVRDLVDALTLVANAGGRLSPDDVSQGVYFAAADEMPSFAEFGRMIGNAVGRERVRVVKCGPRLVRLLGLFNSILARVVRRPFLLNLDKAREATAGSWCCTSDRIRHELGFAPAFPIVERLRQTAHWYRLHGWLPATPVPQEGISIDRESRSTSTQ